MDTSKVNISYYEDLNGKSLIQKNVFKRIIKSYNATTKKDTSYWVISFSELYTLNALNQISSIRYIASDPQYDYSTLYSKVVYKYCGDISLPSNEIHENLAFTISPNPTNHTLFINAHEEKDLNGVIQIVDVLGNIIRSEKINNLREIDVSNLSNGIYFLKIHVDKSIGVKKFIVQH
jgi:Secretion system C-terminal sorting domain